MAPVPSWITIRRPDVSSRVAGIVLTPTTETIRSLSGMARAIVTPAGVPEPGFGVGEDPDDAGGDEIRVTSPRSRSQSR